MFGFLKRLFRRRPPATAEPAHPSQNVRGSMDELMAQEVPELREVVFTPLMPVIAASQMFSLEQITLEWIKEQVGSQAFDLGLWTFQQGLVTRAEAHGFYLYGTVNPSNPNKTRPYSIEIALTDGNLTGVCSCSLNYASIMTTGALPRFDSAHIPCKHIASVLIGYAQRSTPTAETPPEPVTCVCPVTRQKLQAGSQIFMCQQCGTAYSPEGWEFLQDVDKGRCCNCHAPETIQPFTLSG